jgi:hypothetical protein
MTSSSFQKAIEECRSVLPQLRAGCRLLICRHWFAYEDYNTTIKANRSPDHEGTYDWHGRWTDDRENPGGRNDSRAVFR